MEFIYANIAEVTSVQIEDMAVYEADLEQVLDLVAGEVDQVRSATP